MKGGSDSGRSVSLKSLLQHFVLLLALIQLIKKTLDLLLSLSELKLVLLDLILQFIN